jgi:hypothetical protein
MLNMLAWPGPIEEGMVTAHLLREMQENEDRFRQDFPEEDPIRPPVAAGQKFNRVLNVGFVILCIVFFIWLLWILVQKLTFGPP